MFSEDIQKIIIGSSSDLDICQVRRYPQDVHNCMKVLFCHQAVHYFQRMRFNLKKRSSDHFIPLKGDTDEDTGPGLMYVMMEFLVCSSKL